jgi:hypothetical protein
LASPEGLRLVVEDLGLLNCSFEGLNELCCGNDRGFIALVPPSIELPKIDDGGGPAGVYDPAEDGGGPAGVVEGFVAPNENGLPEFLSGVDGGLDEKGG